MKQLIILGLFLILFSTLSKGDEGNDQSDFSEEQGAMITEEELIENHEVQKSIETANCTDVSQCEDTCLLGHVYGDDGCMTCECRRRGIFDGDIEVDSEESYCELMETYLGKPCKTRTKRAAYGTKWPKVGKYVDVPYEFRTKYKSKELAAIQSAFESFHTKTCVRFRPRTSSDKSYLKIYRGTGCFAFVGKSSRPQEVSIGRGCATKGIVIHQLMHSLGFWHEQLRSDRNYYVRILEENIKPDNKIHFETMTALTYQTRYDTQSIMHSNGTAYSKNGKPTIVNKFTGQPIDAQRIDFSFSDVKDVNDYYNCDPSTACYDSDYRCPDWACFCTGSRYSPHVRKACPKLCGACKSFASISTSHTQQDLCNC